MHGISALLNITLFHWDDGTCLQLVPCRRLLAAPVSLRPVQLRAPVLNQSPLCRPTQASAATCSRVSARQVVQCLCKGSRSGVHTICSAFPCHLMAEGVRTYEHRGTCRCEGFASWLFWLSSCMCTVYACSMCFSGVIFCK